MKKRQRKKWLKQYNLYVNPKDTWCLDITIAEFVLPRLKLFKKLNNGYPGIEDMDTPEKWDEALDKMINAFEIITSEDTFYECWSAKAITGEEIKSILKQQKKEVDEGLQLFAKWFHHLWW